MGIFKMLFGSPDMAVKTAGTIAKGVDSIIYTPEEKAEMRAKAMDWVAKYMESTQGQNVARRLIALVVAAQWALLVNIGVVCYLFGFTDKAEYVFRILTENVNESFGYVMLFYFAAGALTRTFGGKQDPKK